jgi:4-carboxymuconolactone decarboxylase
MITEIGWGAVWGRPGLERKTRSMLNLAMLSALNRPHEFEIHMRGAIRNGVTKAEVREILIQVISYCGFPAAIDSFRIAKRIFAEHEAAKPKRTRK